MLNPDSQEIPSQGSAIEVRNRFRSIQPMYFKDLPEALKYCWDDKSNPYLIQFPLEVGIKGKLSDDQMLELTIGGRAMIVPRKMGDRPGLTVSTNFDFENWFDLCLPVYEYNDRVFDRGIFWVSINDEKRAQLKFGLLANNPASLPDLIERTSEGEMRATQIINDAFDGIFPER